MPLFILGLLVAVCILAYAIVMYLKSGEADTRPVRERYPEAFAKRARKVMDSFDAANQEHKDAHEDADGTINAKAKVDTDDLRGDLEHLARNFKENAIDLINRTIDKYANGSDEDDEDKTIIFPTDNVEEEKHKRNINSD